MNSFFEKLKSSGEKASIEKKQKEKEVEEIKPEKQKDEKSKRDTVDPKEWFTPEGKLAIDVYQTDLDIVIQTPIAGVKKGDLDISIENDMVIIRGNREKPSGIEEKNYFYQECYWGPFSRQIILPVEGDPSRIKATMKDGILTLKIPKVERERKRKVEIK